jgi:hypothetical protein
VATDEAIREAAIVKPREGGASGPVGIGVGIVVSTFYEVLIFQ